MASAKDGAPPIPEDDNPYCKAVNKVCMRLATSVIGPAATFPCHRTARLLECAWAGNKLGFGDLPRLVRPFVSSLFERGLLSSDAFMTAPLEPCGVLAPC